jgi:eukaryotic-like serine/threonine-protein kinase
MLSNKKILSFERILANPYSMSNLVEFFKSKLFLKNVLAYFAFVIFVFVGLSIFLGTYTRPGQTFEVPDFVGDKVNIQDIDLYMKDLPLRYEVVETVFRTDLPEGTVFFQQPGSTARTGMRVKKNRSIKLRVSTRNKMVEMPDLAGKSSIRFAEQKLTNRGFKVGIEYVYSSEGRNQVLEQKFNGKRIEPGTIVPFGSKIILVVSKGKGDAEIELPNLIGLTICDARRRLENVNVVASYVCIDCEPGNADQECRAVIYVQEPDHEYFTTIAVGSSMVFKAWLVKPEDVDKFRQQIMDIDIDKLNRTGQDIEIP